MPAPSQHYRNQEQKFLLRAETSSPRAAPLWLEIAQTYRLLAESEEGLQKDHGCMIPQSQ